MGKSVLVRQDSALSALVPLEASFAAGVDFSASVTGLTASVTPPDKSSVALPADSSSSFFLERAFSSEAQRDSAFPDGRYTISVSGTQGGTFSIDTLAQLPEAVRITNLDSIYQSETVIPDSMVVSWSNPGLLTSGRTFSQIEIKDLQGRVVAHSPEFGDPRALSTGSNTYEFRGVPFAAEYIGEVTVAFLVFTQKGTTEQISIRSVTTRFSIRRPIRDTTPPRLITQRPAIDGTLADGVGPITLSFSEPMDRTVTFDSGYFIARSPGIDSASSRTLQSSWSADGLVLTLRLTSPLPTGAYEIMFGNRLKDLAGNALAANVTLQFYVGVPKPWIPVLPSGGLTAQGAPVLFTVDAKGPGLSYQWQRDGRDVAGATGPVWRLPFADWLPGPAPRFTVVVSNSAGRTTGIADPFSLQPSDYPRLVNLSVRNRAGTGERALITGFSIAGLNPSTRVLLRAIGPGLAPFGITNALPDPQLRVQPTAGGPVTIVDDWNATPFLVAESAQVGAFALPAPSKDAVTLLQVALGGHTAIVAAADGREGIALAEVYQTGNEQLLPLASRLVNLSARAFAGTGADTLIAGFTIQGRLKKSLLIRAVGPGLAPFGVTGLLANPELKIYRSGDATPIVQNDDWEQQPAGTPSVAALAQSVGAFALPPGSRDATIVTLLSAGSYTVHVTGVGGTSGVALVEIYEL